MGRIGDKVDASLLTPAESQAYHKKLAEDMRAAGLHANIDEDAFLDLTDLQVSVASSKSRRGLMRHSADYILAFAES